MKIAFMLSDRINIQHGLGWVRMPAITGVDDADMGGDMPGDEMSRPTLSVADHKHIDVHRLNISDGIQKTLTLGGGRRRDIDVQHIRREALGRQFKGRPGPCAGLKKKIDDGFAAKERYLFNGLLGHTCKGICRIHDQFKKGTVKALHRQKVAKLAIRVSLKGVLFSRHRIIPCASRASGPLAPLT